MYNVIPFSEKSTEEDLVAVLKVLRTIYDALTAVDDWGDLNMILDGSTVDCAGDLLNKYRELTR